LNAPFLGRGKESLPVGCSWMQRSFFFLGETHFWFSPCPFPVRIDPLLYRRLLRDKFVFAAGGDRPFFAKGFFPLTPGGEKFPFPFPKGGLFSFKNGPLEARFFRSPSFFPKREVSLSWGFPPLPPPQGLDDPQFFRESYRNAFSWAPAVFESYVVDEKADFSSFSEISLVVAVSPGGILLSWQTLIFS